MDAYSEAHHVLYLPPLPASAYHYVVFRTSQSHEELCYILPVQSFVRSILKVG